MKKKVIAVMISLMLTASLAGCSGEISNDYITITQYKDLEVPQVESTEVTEEKIENVINSNLELAATKESVTDRAAQEGDTVNMDYTGTIEGVAFEGGTASGATIELGENSGYIGATGDYEGFADQIVGHSTGEEFDITVQFPEDYTAEMAGKVADFYIKINEIYQMKTPELTDEWVQENSEESKTVEEYKKEIKKQLEEENTESVDGELENAVMEVFLEKVEVKKYPKGAVEEQVQEVKEYYTSIAGAYGMEFSDFLANYMNGMTEEEFNEQAEKAAQNTVKRNEAVKLLAEKKHLEPSEEEYKKEIEKYAEDAGAADVEAFKEQYGEDSLKLAILTEKVGEYLADNCIQVESSDTEAAE